jgi:hypothetical protein
LYQTKEKKTQEKTKLFRDSSHEKEINSRRKITYFKCTKTTNKAGNFMSKFGTEAVLNVAFKG